MALFLWSMQIGALERKGRHRLSGSYLKVNASGRQARMQVPKQLRLRLRLRFAQRQPPLFLNWSLPLKLPLLLKLPLPLPLLLKWQ